MLTWLAASRLSSLETLPRRHAAARNAQVALAPHEPGLRFKASSGIRVLSWGATSFGIVFRGIENPAEGDEGDRWYPPSYRLITGLTRSSGCAPFSCLPC